ncbi:hypothetical protein COLO4_01917, partial [Corchorus olitorius]
IHPTRPPAAGPKQGPGSPAHHRRRVAQPPPGGTGRRRPAAHTRPRARNRVQLAGALHRRRPGAGCFHRQRRPGAGGAVPRRCECRGAGQQPRSHQQPEEQPGNPALPTRADPADRCPALPAEPGQAAVRRGVPRPAVPPGLAGQYLQPAGAEPVAARTGVGLHRERGCTVDAADARQLAPAPREENRPGALRAVATGLI